MDLQQRKLTKSEWDSIETRVSPNEIDILNLIVDGYDNVNIKRNYMNSILSYLKIEYSDMLEDYIYNKFFISKINKIETSYKVEQLLTTKLQPANKIKKSYLIRLQRHTPDTIKGVELYENILIEEINMLFKYKNKKDITWQMHYLTLYKLIKNSVNNINKHIITIVQNILKKYEDDISIKHIIENSSQYIEKNKKLLQYKDMTLYAHQKEIFTICKDIHTAKLILYIAPTGTGKTLTPLGLLGRHKVIFVCAARHVGLALAKAAISVNKKVAFAFGCETADDIRLHYFAAKDYTTNWKSGGIWKVDNSVGDKVELMICDIKSYLSAMYYMLSFNEREEMITYWDEPTITLDYPEHDFHSIIQKNWNDNLVPNMILSSATLPKLHEIPDTIGSFREKFADISTNIHNIISHECYKSIPILNKFGYVVLPHYLTSDYIKILDIVKHCENSKTLLRYMDLKEIVRFIKYVNDKNYVKASLDIENYFDILDDLTMEGIKLYYLRLLKSFTPEIWNDIYSNLYLSRDKHIIENNTIDNKGVPIRKVSSFGPTKSTSSMLAGESIFKIKSEQNIPQANNGGNNSFATYITTKDAYTLTDGPTIYLANDVEKIAKFCIQQANIPSGVMTDLLESIEFNNRVNDKIEKLSRDLEDSLPKETQDKNDKGKKGSEKVNKMDRAMNSSQTSKIKKELETYQSMIKVTQLNDIFVPNKLAHLHKWCGEDLKVINAFSSNIDEDTIIKIMMLNDVANSWKILLMMGIGVFTNQTSISYTEIMKNLAEQQKLYLIIASSDYVYGTNYQFCHGYISKDMTDLTQEKIIQSLGRIGRNGIQQDYTIRFRDDSQINTLFSPDAEKPEVLNMNRLFNTSNTQ